MKLLLDTHTFLWWATNSKRLSQKVFASLQDPDNATWISLVSLWEIQLKTQAGKLTLNKPLKDLVAEQQQNGFRLLPITLEHVVALDRLPFHHKDPFDRLLVAQAIEEKATLLSRDAVLQQYPVSVDW